MASPIPVQIADIEMFTNGRTLFIRTMGSRLAPKPQIVSDQIPIQMTNDQNKAIRAVLRAVVWALRLGVSREQIIKAIQGGERATTIGKDFVDCKGTASVDRLSAGGAKHYPNEIARSPRG